MAEKWIQGAIGEKGALHRQLGVPAKRKIPAKTLASARARAKRTGNTKLLRRLNLARTLTKLNSRRSGRR